MHHSLEQLCQKGILGVGVDGGYSKWCWQQDTVPVRPSEWFPSNRTAQDVSGIGKSGGEVLVPVFMAMLWSQVWGGKGGDGDGIAMPSNTGIEGSGAQQNHVPPSKQWGMHDPGVCSMTRWSWADQCWISVGWVVDNAVALLQSKPLPALVIVVHIVLSIVILVITCDFCGAFHTEMGVDVESPDVWYTILVYGVHVWQRFAPMSMWGVLGRWDCESGSLPWLLAGVSSIVVL
ncbi:hypothetical protein EDD85DRAFT_787881 [Armillaria nabsnona]|nr:hypothetical protein EDD85DRAFT_787881 [Armillaria nabsnona]